MHIKEISEKAQISIRMIRFYEEKNLIKPSRDQANYRVFSEQDLHLIQDIIAMRDIGFSLKEIQNILPCLIHIQNNEPLCSNSHKLFKTKLININKRIELLKSNYEKISKHLSNN